MSLETPETGEKPAEKPVDGAAEGDEDEEDEGSRGFDPRQALRAERGRRKELSAKLKETEKTLAELKPQVEEYNQLLPHLPALLKAASAQAAAPAAPTNGKPDPELVGFAEEFGLVDAVGGLDLERAAKIRDRVAGTARGVAAAEAAPAKQQAAIANANQMKERAYKAVDAEGRLYAKKEAIDAVFANMSPEDIANPDKVVWALAAARGFQGPGDAPLSEPLHTEGGGRAPRGGPAPLTPLERGVMALREKTEKDWRKLEDDPTETGDWRLE